jgi:hydroxymethylglutaryl-CoA lyase
MDRIEIVEVGPRDGLQNEKAELPVAVKIELVERLADAGLKSVEAGAFVSPKWVPQMASSAEVMAGITRKAGVSYPVLTPNMKGYEGAKQGQADTVAVFGAASEAFSLKNTNATIEESFARMEPILATAKHDGIRVRGYVSCVLGCPYQGEVPIADVIRVSKRLYEIGCYEISLGDTIGVGTAGETRTLIRALKEEIPVETLAGHFHDTYGQALSNIVTAIEEGVRTFDASVSGLGGCPYAKGASGNVATEDIVYMAHGSGFETGVDLDALIEISTWISDHVGRKPCSKVTRACTAA